MLLRQHGDRAPARFAERIGKLATADEAGGVVLWREVAQPSSPEATKLKPANDLSGKAVELQAEVVPLCSHHRQIPWPIRRANPAVLRHR